MKRQKISRVFLLCFAISVHATAQALCLGHLVREPLKIFHIDMNSVSLRKDYIEKLLRKVSAMGYNAILWEVEGKIKWETCPECVSVDALSKNEFKDLLAYSRQLGLEPIPLLQTIGHAEYVLQQQPYVPFREKPDRYDCYCTSNQQLRRFLKSWIAEYQNLFGEIRYFHLGGDEAYIFGTCAECSKAVATRGANRFIADYLKDIASVLLNTGIRPCIWDDMIMKKADDIGAIPKDFVIWDWNYWDSGGTPSSVMIWSLGKRVSKSSIPDDIKRIIPEIVDKNGELRSFYVCDFLKRKGFDVVTCSSSRSHGDAVFAGKHKVHSGNIITGSRKCLELGLLGTCVTSWAVRLSNYEIQEPWFLLAPLAMSSPGISEDSLLSLVSFKLFGIQGGGFFDAISDVGYSFPFSDGNTTGIMWTGMKDMHPAPKDYIRNLIDKWKSEGVWETKTKMIWRADSTIRSGIQKLQKFLPQVTDGYDIIYQWSLAGNYQLWQAVIAQAIVRKAEGKSATENSELIKQIGRLKATYIQWSEEWLTPGSALQSSGLIYDAIENYFQE